MAESPIRLALVDPNERSREALRRLLLGIDRVVLDNECARYEFFLEVVAQSQPNGVVVVLDSAADRAVELVAQFETRHPNIPIIAVSEQDAVLLRAHQAGARGLLTVSAPLEEMVRLLNKLFPPDTIATGTVIAILGSRGGVGCTSLAVNLGCALAQHKKHRAILMDLDLVQGDADVALDLSPPYRLDSLALIDKDRLDLHLLKQSLSIHATGLALLARPERILDVGLIKEESVGRLITLAQVDCTHLLLNLSKGWTNIDLQALRMADQIFLVSQLELSSLRNAYLMLTALVTLELGDKVRVIMNRVGAQFASDRISIQNAEEVLGHPVDWQLPNDSQPMLGSWNEGKPLVTYAPRSKICQSIAALAEDLRELTPSAALRAVPKSKSAGIFSFLRRP